ncbi:endo-1,4-beta-xylanase [Hymenobacter properus]|uniref:endo-1,4-beta-xylanase n=1 Tax=Hymenobacter properus TaxID=2791026 RepID=A0A931BHM6_9BACT|nr:endo-1,4-beta-xylanase [Hymenobacter properus]MBF9142656.1 endo-1,4-beta-xylanase [Hymenobacter properus]MBR7721464.1 endo-1,4-beta-xylanase [Microvirga sp. SRT04]
MKKLQRVFLTLAVALSGHLTLSAQNAPVPFQAESGTSAGGAIAGAAQGDWAFRTTGTPAVTYATSLTDVTSITGGGSFPGNANRVLSYTVTFPGAGTYDLYARIRVGANGANDDSFFYGNSFGAKGVTTASDWVNCNNLFNIGYTGATQVVDGGGAAGTGVWKWINLSKYTFGGAALVNFTVPAGALIQTFQIGAREDGLDFDKFVFGETGRYFTVANLDAGAQGSSTPPVTFTPTGAPFATGKPKYLGCAYSSAQAPFFGNYWDAVTPENGGKWGSVEGTRGTYNWTEADAAYAQAVATGGPFRFHTLIWGTQQPTWLVGLSQADQLTAINQWFAAVRDHFAGKRIDFIDVVNEPTHQPPVVRAGVADCGGYIAALGGSGTTGWDWVITSFQLARQYFPNAKLMLNEYSVENEPARAATYVTIANLLKARGLIDAIGIQGHSFSLASTSTASIQANMATLAATNLPLYVTEFDLDGLADADQLANYQRVFPLFWENPAVRGITMWGYRVGHWRTAQGANLANADNTERPALVWLRNYVASTYTGPMWTGNTSSAWSTASNWIANNGAPANALVSRNSTYTLPLATDDAFFPGYAANQPTVSGAQAIRSVTLSGSGAALTTPAGSTLTLTGNLTNNGGALTGSGNGTIVLAGTAAQTIGGTSVSNFQNLTVGAAGANLAAAAGVRQLLSLAGNLTTNGRTFTLLSDATGTAMVVNANGTVVGNATVQRYIDQANPGLGYRHYAPPVSGSTVADLQTSGYTPVVNPAYNTQGNTVTTFPTVFAYNPSRLFASADLATSAFDYGWESPTALSDALNPGQGYTVNIPASQTVDFVGALNNGAISRSGLTRTAQPESGWQLLGNPYPAPLDWETVSTTGLDAAVYVFRSSGQYAGTYSSYVRGGASTNGGANLLPVAQGFFVRTSSAATPGAINFSNTARATTYASPVFQRSTTTDPLVRLDLRAATGPADETVVSFASGASAGFDATADAYKLTASGAPVLASEISATEFLSINTLPALGAADVSVALRVVAPQAGAYTLRATELLNLPAGRYAYLRDAQTGILFDLSQPAGYTVSLAAGPAATGRFALLITQNRVLATAPAALSQQVALYPNPAHGSVSLSLPAALGSQAVAVSLLNALGQTVLHQTLPASTDLLRPLSLPGLAPGIYTVRLQTAAGTVSKRLTIE